MKTNPSPAKNLTPPGENRRTFIKRAATVAAAAGAVGILKTPVYGQSQAPSTGRVIGANDRINVAYVGVGKQGMVHVNSQKKFAAENNIAQVAVCDLYQKHLDKAREVTGVAQPAGYGDHRKLLERKDVDAVVVATVDNWHAQVTLDALAAGKHVFCEKPMSRYLAESFEVYDVVKKSGKTFVIGSQGCMDPKWHKAAEWIRAGKIGPLVWGQGSYCRNSKSEWSYAVDREVNEKNLDWNRWLGRAPKIPFDPERYFSWHKYYAYNSGIIGNLLPHRFMPLMVATGNPEFPRRVTATGTRKVSTDREITDTTHLLAEFPSGLTLVVAGTTVNQIGLPEMLRGQKATLHFASQGNRLELQPETLFAESDGIEPESFADQRPTEQIPVLEKNFFDCVRSGKTPVANVELAIRAQTVLCLAEMSERLGMALFFDEKGRTIRNGEGRQMPALTYESVVPAPPV